MLSLYDHAGSSVNNNVGYVKHCRSQSQFPYARTLPVYGRYSANSASEGQLPCFLVRQLLGRT